MGYQHQGGEILVNTSTAGNQAQPVITRLTTGGFVILWTEQDGSGKGQVFDADGLPSGSEFAATGYSIAALPGGGFVATWESAGDVMAQVFDAGGGASGSPIVVNSTTAGVQARPSVAALETGGFVISWDDARLVGQGDVEVRGQRFDTVGNKLGGEIPVNTVTTGFQEDSEVTGLAGGGFVVTWNSNGGIRAQVHDGSGVKLGSEFAVATGSPIAEPQIAALASGGFVMVWTGNASGGGGTGVDGVYAQIFSASGARVGTELLIATDGPAQVLSLDVAALASGGFVVTWAADSGDDRDSNGTAIKAQILDDLGNELGAEIVVNTSATGNQVQPSVAGLPSGDFVVSWVDPSQAGGDTSGSAIRAQLFHAVAAMNGTLGADDLDGTALNDEMLGLGGNDLLEGGAGGDTIDGGEGDDIVRGESGGDVLLVSGHGFDQAEGGSGLDTLVIDYSDSFLGVDTVAGPSANAALGGFDGTYDDGAGHQIVYSSIERFILTLGNAADTITTGSGDDIIRGGGGNDILDGGDGSDLIAIAGAGHAEVIGGGGSSRDTLQIDWSNAETAISMPTPSVVGGALVGSFGNGGDRSVAYGGIERFLITTGHGSDTISLNLGGHVVNLGGGDDILVADNGANVADGGSGVDGLSFNLSGSTEIAWNLQTGSFSGLGSYANFEYFANLTLGGGNDRIVTGALAHDDHVSGGAGLDTITVVNGHDTVDGGSGSDTLVIDYSTSTTSVMTTGSPGGITTGTSGTGVKGQIGSGTRSVTFDNIERFDVRTGSGGDTIVLGLFDRVTNDIVSLGANNDWVDVGRGTDRADGGAGIDGLDADMSAATVDIHINVIANTYSGAAGTMFTNFEYLGLQSETYGSGFRTGSGNDVVVTGHLAIYDNIHTNGGDDRASFSNGLDTYNGGDGVDTLVLDYAAATTNVFSENGVNDGDQDGDFSGKFVDNNSRMIQFVNVEKFVITTGSGNDNIMGGSAADILTSGAGNDILDGRGGADMMSGGLGNDFYYVDNLGDQAIEASSAGQDEVRTGLASYTLAANIEILSGSSNAGQTLTGNNLVNLITGGQGNDVIDGGADFDIMEGGLGNDVYYVDHVYDHVGEAIGEGMDEVRTSAGSKAGPNYELYTMPHNVEIMTGTSAGAQGVRGNYGDNIINMGVGADLIVLDDGGVDTVNGGGGNDFIYYGGALTNADVTNGGAGIDTVGLLGNYSAGITFTAANLIGVERLAIYTGGGSNCSITMSNANVAAGTEFFVTAASLGVSEALIFNGSAETDGRFTIHGGNAADTIVGGAQNDFILGNAGADLLFGMAGTDFVTGGGGADQLRGGANGDVFRYQSTSDSAAGAADQILDFQHVDRIDLSAIDARSGTAGNEAFTFIGSAAFSNSAGQLRAYQSGAGWFVEGDVNGDSIADLVIQVTLADPAPLGAGDFVL